MNECNDGGGVIGIDGEFLESILPFAAIPYGFFGMESLDGNTLKIEPSLPSKLDYFKTENFLFNGVKYDLTIFDNAVMINSVRGDASGLSLQVVLNAPKAGQKVYVNGKATNRYTVIDGKVKVVVPLQSATIEIK